MIQRGGDAAVAVEVAHQCQLLGAHVLLQMPAEPPQGGDERGELDAGSVRSPTGETRFSRTPRTPPIHVGVFRHLGAAMP